jgi:4,5-dihydroxyphthalate decarboxylase
VTRELTVAVGSYDHVRDLVSGRVRAEGLDLTFLELEIEQILQRFAHLREWDVSEFSLAQYVAMRSRGDDSLVAIPVFPSRVFRHGSIFVRPETVTDPADLAGRRVGVPEWVQTAGVWIRGILEREYDVDLRTISWTQAGVNEPGRGETVAVELPVGITVEPRLDASLDALLRGGEIDAVLSARAPAGLGDGAVERLIAAYPAVEREWWRRTGIFPIMHVVVITRNAYERDPWIAANLTAAFEEAKRRGVRRLIETTASSIPLPWAPETVAELAPLCGEEWWPYGVEPNRATLEAFVEWADEQGVAARRLPLEDLFAAETLFRPRV